MREADIADLIGRHEIVGEAVDVPAVVWWYRIIRGRKFLRVIHANQQE